MMKQMGLKYTLELAQWSDVVDKLTSGEIDMVMGITQSAQREEKILFSLSHLYIYNSFLVRGDSGITSPHQLRGKIIAVDKGGIAEYYLSEDILTDNIISLPNTYQSFQLLKEGKCDAIMCSKDIINYLRAANDDFSFFKEFPSNMPPKQYSMGISLENNEFQEKVDRALGVLHQNGTFEKIYEHWFSNYGNKSYTKVLLTILLVITIIALFLWGMVYFLRKKNEKIYKEIINRSKEISKLYQENNIVLKSLPMGMAIFDADGRQQYINKHFVDIFGIANIDEHLAKHISIFDDPIISEETKLRIKKGKDFDIEIEYDLNVPSEENYYSSYLKTKKYLFARICFVRNTKNKPEKMIMMINDITESKEREIKLKNSELDLRLALDAGGLDVWIYDAKGKTFSSMYGSIFFEGGTITYDDVISKINPDSREKWGQAFSDLISKRKNEIECVISFLNPNIETDTYVKSRMIAMISETGEVYSIIGTYKDITEEYLKEQELKDYNTKTELIIKSCNIIQWDYDIRRKVVRTYTVGSILPGIDITLDMYLTFVHPDDREDTKRYFHAMENGEIEFFEHEIRLLLPTSKGYKTVIISCVPIKDANGKIIRYTGLRRDITEEVELNNKLLDAQKQLYLALRAGKIIPLMWDITVDKMYITLDDIKKENNFDMERQGMPMQEILSYINVVDRARTQEALDQIRQGIKKDVLEEVYYSFPSNGKDKTLKQYYEVHLIVDKHDKDGNAIRAVGYMQNTTERKIMYNELQKSKEEAEASNKLKSAFLANMSHEIRTPLNAIVGFSDLMSDATSDEERQDYKNIIQMNSDLLLKLINDILDLSKIESGYLDLKPSTFDLSELLNNLSTSLLQRITSPNVVFSLENPYKKCIVNTDKNRLTQVVTNFTTNAIKFTTKGSIVLRYEMINNGIKISVTDTGIGIPKEKIPKVFMRFEKLDDFAQGSGLGMAISKAIMEANKGTIGVESTQGKGSTFWAWWPIVPESME